MERAVRGRLDGEIRELEGRIARAVEGGGGECEEVGRARGWVAVLRGEREGGVRGAWEGFGGRWG